MRFALYLFLAGTLASLALGAPLPASALPIYDGITFAGQKDEVYLPVHTIAQALGWTVGWDAPSKTVTLDDRAVSPDDIKTLESGEHIMRVRALRQWGASVFWNEALRMDCVTLGERAFCARVGAKQVLVDRTHQLLKAWQGHRLVLKSRISTGREGKRTPSGSFHVLKKEWMHRSKLYDNAPMPYSVQVIGNIFVHGFRSVPHHPASHGCIRLPLNGRDPARWFFDWVDIGTPVHIVGHWS